MAQVNLSIGERLKSARDTKGLSLEEASRFTKIQRKSLEAIEEDRLDEELDPAYAKIFLKKYAGFLGLDPISIVEEYISFRGPIPERPIAVQTQAQDSARQAESLQKIGWAAAVVLMAALGAAILAYAGYTLYSERSKSPASASHIKRMAQKKTRTPASAIRRSAETAKAAPAAKLLVPRSQPLKLTVRTKADVWMQVKSDGSVIFQNVLARGAQETWTAQNSLELWTGNAAAMELSLNGKPLEGSGAGVKKGIRVTHEGLRMPE